jgi:two-component system LytT family response regulator
VAGEGASAAETVELATAVRPDLIFLDIRMPGMDGFDVVHALSSRHDLTMPRIVFTTAYDQYAVRAFEVHALDYLLKPFTQERLHAALRRFRERLTPGASPANGRESPFATRIVFKSRGRILFLPVSEIRLIGAEENYVRLHTRDETHLLRETMAGLEQRLDPQVFLRVHRSTIVNLQYVREMLIENEGDASAVLTDGRRVPVSRGYRSRIQAMFHR